MSESGSRKTLYLHIGLNKTGSTFVQRCLRNNEGRLAKRGFLYPCKRRAPYFQRGQHVPLAAALTGLPVYWLNKVKSRRLDSAVPAFLEEAKAFEGENIILSSEAFGSKNVTREIVEGMKDLLADFDVKVVAYLRRQDDYILSTYQQDVKVGSRHKFDFAERMSGEQNRFYNRIAPYISVFGKEQVIIRPYDKSRWKGGELFLDFLQVIGCPDEGLEMVAAENEGLDFRHVNLLRDANQFLAPLGSEPNGKDDQMVRTSILRHLKKDKAAGLQTEKLALSNRQIREVQEYFLEENKRLWGEQEGADFVRPKKDEPLGNTDKSAADWEIGLRLIIELCRENIRLQNKIQDLPEQQKSKGSRKAGS